jgi:hypothetical protein
MLPFIHLHLYFPTPTKATTNMVAIRWIENQSVTYENRVITKQFLAATVDWRMPTATCTRGASVAAITGVSYVAKGLMLAARPA